MKPKRPSTKLEKAPESHCSHGIAGCTKNHDQSINIGAGLKSRGNRMTRARAALINLFSDSHSPITAIEIGEALAKLQISVNKTTIYRELDFLMSEKIIREIDLLDGKKRCELLQQDSHHHHLVCTKCKQIRCVELPSDLDSLEHKIEGDHNSKITSHVLEFFGACAQCTNVTV